MAGQKNCKRWFIDLNTSSVQKSELPPPFSFTKKANVEHVEHSRDVDPDLIVKRSWDIALGPVKQIPMNLFMLWMAGNTVSLFPIMMVGMLLFRSVSAFFSLGATFKTIEGAQAPLQKLSFIGGNVLAVLMGLYKCNSMGLLPTHASDWLAFAQPPQQMEYASGGLSLT